MTEYAKCTCPRDPDDEVDPGDPLSTCPVHGWSDQETAVAPAELDEERVSGGNRRLPRVVRERLDAERG